MGKTLILAGGFKKGGGFCKRVIFKAVDQEAKNSPCMRLILCSVLESEKEICLQRLLIVVTKKSCILFNKLIEFIDQCNILHSTWRFAMREIYKNYSNVIKASFKPLTIKVYI